MESGNQKAVFNLGYMYFLIKKYDLAIETLKKLSDEPRAYITLGKIYYIKEDFENCEKYLKLAGSHSTAYLVLGKLYKKSQLQILKNLLQLALFFCKIICTYNIQKGATLP